MDVTMPILNLHPGLLSLIFPRTELLKQMPFIATGLLLVQIAMMHHPRLD
jgi:hypothetical protein